MTPIQTQSASISAASLALLEQGAYPVMTDAGWHVDLSAVEPMIKDYFDRSLPLADNETASYGKAVDIYTQHNMQAHFPMNEGNYVDALPKILNRGGIFIGTGHILPVIYAGAANASHVYSIDMLGEVTFGLIPMWGALFAMAENRAQLASLLFGKPISKELSYTIENEKPPPYIPKKLSLREQILLDAAKILSSRSDLEKIETSMGDDDSDHHLSLRVLKETTDPQFLFNVVNSLAALFIKCGAPFDLNYLAAFLATQLCVGRTHPRALSKHHGELGGPLFNAESFQRSRDIFLQGRITGVTGDLIGRSIATIVERTRAERSEISSVYLSNAIDWFGTTEHGIVKDDYVCKFFDRLKGIPQRNNVLVISALACRHTEVHTLGDVVNSLFNADLSPNLAVETMRRYYMLHRLVAVVSDEKLTSSDIRRLIEGYDDHIQSISDEKHRYKTFFKAVYKRMQRGPIDMRDIDIIIERLIFEGSIPAEERTLLGHLLKYKDLQK